MLLSFYTLQTNKHPKGRIQGKQVASKRGTLREWAAAQVRQGESEICTKGSWGRRKKELS